MNVFITDNLNALVPKLELITDIQYVNDYSLQTIQKSGKLYLVVFGTYEEIILRVENENYVGISFDIKLPSDTEWKKELVFKNPNGNPDIYEFDYRWSVMNHLLFVKNTQNVCFLNAYIKRLV